MFLEAVKHNKHKILSLFWIESIGKKKMKPKVQRRLAWRVEFV